ncbi:MAG: hypothetical protein GY860_24150 [Desulfobacteraceae bacterium]|nr:hypothetical protein [Desulfobacteraceae bacterium]
MNDLREDDYGVVIFKPGTSPGEKKKGLFFFTVLTLIILAQACFWLFANSVEPITWGMPFGMFSVVMLILLEFATLAAMYWFETREESDKGGDK